MSGKLIIIADDFTGANDTGVQFRKSGYSVNVVISSEKLSSELSGSDVLSVDLESRMDTPDIAFKKAFETGKQIRESGSKAVVYKKLDSAFRGNPGAELDGLLAGLEARIAFLAPAYPSFGRTTENGKVFINNTELAKTGYFNDPRNPVKQSAIEDIIKLQCRRRCCHVAIKDLVNIEINDFKWICDKAAEGFEIFIFDSKTESDLETIAHKLENFSSLPYIFSGSAGLAGHLNCNNIFSLNALAFVFSGSVTDISMKQINHCARETNCTVIQLKALDLLDDTLSVNDIVQVVNEAIRTGKRRFIFSTAVTHEDVDVVFSEAARRSIPRSSVAQIITERFGSLAADLISLFNPAGVLLTGGETAYNTFKSLNATGMSIETEIIPGLQCGKLKGCSIDSLIATKSGGFGSVDAISKTFDFFKV